jgi:hypothetical protein
MVPHVMRHDATLAAKELRAGEQVPDVRNRRGLSESEQCSRMWARPAADLDRD